MHSQEIYARIENEKIVQWPVTLAMINERNRPVELYYKCYFPSEDEHPTPELFQKVVQTPLLIGQAVYISEKLVYKSIDEMFALLAETAGYVNESGQFLINPELITPGLIDAFEVIVKLVVQEILDAFAATRGYDDIGSVCNYTSSKIPKYKAEAERAVDIRDETWIALTAYVNDIRAGIEAPPMSWDDIAAHIAPLSWEV